MTARKHLNSTTITAAFMVASLLFATCQLLTS